MNKTVLLLIIGLAVLMSYTEIQPPEFYVIKGEIKNYEGEIYLSRAVDTLYYSNHFREDTAAVVDGKFNFRLSTKCKTPLPFRIRTTSSMTNQFVLEPQNQRITIDEMSPIIKPVIFCENSTLHSEDVILAERRISSREGLNTAMKNIYNSNYSTDSIQKLLVSAQDKYKEKTLLILEGFSEDYPKSYVSFWYLAMSQMYYGYDINIENAYKNLSPNIKESDVGKIFEQKMLMSKLSQTGSYFPSVETKE